MKNARRTLTPAQFQALIEDLVNENAAELERTMSWHHGRMGGGLHAPR